MVLSWGPGLFFSSLAIAESYEEVVRATFPLPRRDTR
jgi:hypothetical protein